MNYRGRFGILRLKDFLSFIVIGRGVVEGSEVVREEKGADRCFFTGG